VLELSPSSVMVQAEVNPNGSPVSDCHVDYGLTAAYGSSVPCEPAPGSGTTPVSVSADLTHLTAETTYHFRIVATGAGGSGESGDQTFTTSEELPPPPPPPPPPPSAITGAAGAIGEHGAVLGATVNPNGSAVSDCHFEYGATASYGKSAACKPAPGSGTSPIAVSAAVEGLTPGTTYHFRIVATSAAGRSEGADSSFATTAPPPLPLVSPLPLATTGASASGAASSTGAQSVLPFAGAASPQPDATLAARHVRVARSGRLVLVVACAGGESTCIGTITLSTLHAVRAGAGHGAHVAHGASASRRAITLAVGGFAVSGGRTDPVTLRLRPRGRALLARLHSLLALATLSAHDPRGAERTTRTTLRLQAAGGRRKR
jgi:hypothetical protein